MKAKVEFKAIGNCSKCGRDLRLIALNNCKREGCPNVIKLNGKMDDLSIGDGDDNDPIF